MPKNNSYIWISFIVLVFGIYAIPKIIDRIQNDEIVKGGALDRIAPINAKKSSLYSVGPVPKFELTDQNNLVISNQNYDNKVFVVEFFFSTCPSICPIMNRNMIDIQAKFQNNPDFAIASITINPQTDTPKVLKAHADFLKITSPNWHFLTGNQDTIMNLSNKGFNLYAGMNPKIVGGFEHSGLFALVDKKGIIRSRKDNFGNPIVYYDGLEKTGIAALKADIAILLKE